MTAKFGKAQQVQVFEDEGLPLFEGKPAQPKPTKGKMIKGVWVSSVWDNWIEAVAPAADDQGPAAEQKPLF